MRAFLTGPTIGVRPFAVGEGGRRHARPGDLAAGVTTAAVVIPQAMLRRLPNAADWERRLFREVDDAVAAFAAPCSRHPSGGHPIIPEG
jgi:hypothetical protein